VTGLLDGYQDKRHKLSMYSIAKNIGLPATFVELRHQCTHEELPPLSKLRVVTERSLLWIWEHYWKSLEDFPVSMDADYWSILREYLQWRAGSQYSHEDRQREVSACLQRLNTTLVLEMLTEITGCTTMDVGVLLQAYRLSRVIMSGEKNPFRSKPSEDELLTVKEKSLEVIKLELARADEALKFEENKGKSICQPGEQDMEIDNGEDDNGLGWEIWKGPWIPKPIGAV
jgi:ribosomal biogenesis protein LAS1